ncbi:MAG TPA: MBL fold metallo-hydrolase [Candidatus Binatus sp.]|nr:MBL fold metallo-hydrolase [Candidatus Binatus sp.]
MKFSLIKCALASVAWVALASCATVQNGAPDLGPGFTKIKDGIFVYAAKDGNSTCSVVLTQEGPVVIDTCQTPPDSHRLMAGIKKLTDKPIRFVIDTEVHNDHTFGHWVFSPPGVVVNAEGAGEAMKKGFDPKRVTTLTAQSPEMAEAVKNYKMIVPQLEYRNRMTINLGERTFELYYLKNVHSEADTAIWLPKERVLFAASAANVRSIINLRPFVRIQDVLASYKLMKSLNPEIIVPGHGAVSTTKIFDEYEAFYTLLMKRVGEMAAQGKSLDQIKKDLKMPEYASWGGQNNLAQNITVAYESLKK